jgi:hypothetical protein
MKYFTEFVIRDQQATQAQKILDLLPKAYRFYMSLIKNFAITINENAYNRNQSEKKIEWFIQNIVLNEKFVQFMEQNYNTEVKKTIREPIYNFGFEGVVFFYENNLCVKFKRAPSEPDPQFDVACELAGKLELVPIVDCFDIQVENNKVPAIVMKTIKEAKDVIEQDIKDAYTALTLHMRDVIDRTTFHKNVPHEKIGAALEPEYVVSSAKNIFTRDGAHFRKGAELSAKGEAAIRDMVVILTEVYSATTWLFGNDMAGGKNIGIDAGGKHIPFDLGMGMRTRNLPRPEKKLITID